MADKAGAALLAALQGTLNSQRKHVLGILDGLSDEALRRPVLPSGWNCLGLVQHLTYDVERFWFQCVMTGEPLDAPGVPDDAWQADPDTPAEVILAGYRQEIERANEIIAAMPLDTAPAWWPDFFATYRLDDLQQVILHTITETACHAGHLDAVRELIDGRTWLVLT